MYSFNLATMRFQIFNADSPLILALSYLFEYIKKLLVKSLTSSNYEKKILATPPSQLSRKRPGRTDYYFRDT
jgi:hypothetical protein